MDALALGKEGVGIRMGGSGRGREIWMVWRAASRELARLFLFTF